MFDRDQRGLLEQKIATFMEELRLLHQKPTLDDFQDFWRNKLESGLLELRQELRDQEEDGVAVSDALPATVQVRQSVDSGVSVRPPSPRRPS